MEPNNKELKCIEFTMNYYSPLEKRSFFQRIFTLLFRNYKSGDYVVSENKSFAQLWKDHGLKDNYSVDIMQRHKDKMACIRFWAKTLYSDDIDIGRIYDSIIDENAKYRSELKSSGIRINLGNPIDSVPNKIDEIHGEY